MSSTSSARDCDELFNYHPVRNYQEPWYDYFQTMCHPLIYYAEVQPSFRRSGVRKDPNFFVKAFRWYTQEHHPSLRERERSENNPDFTGFANWLDAKYGQYIQENQQSIEKTTAETRKPKRLFATMKSHFTKRHKGKKSGAGKSCNSCEYIMKPKEMSLTGSECRRSNVKAACSDTLGPNKSGMKSHSLNDVNDSRYDYHKSIEIMVTEGEANEKLDEQCSCAKTEVLTIYESKTASNYGPLPCDRGNNTECQCVVKPAQTNAQTQYQNQSVTKPPGPQMVSKPPPPPPPKQATPKNTSQNQVPAVHSVVKNAASKSHPKPDVSCQCSLEYVPMAPLPISAPTPTRPAKNNDCKCTTSFQDVIKVLCQNCQQNAAVCGPRVAKQQPPVDLPVVPPPPLNFVPPIKTGCLCSIRVNETVQTSDTSIRLDDEVTKYPFFMKIVRADKLITDC